MPLCCTALCAAHRDGRLAFWSKTSLTRYVSWSNCLARLKISNSPTCHPVEVQVTAAQTSAGITYSSHWSTFMSAVNTQVPRHLILGNLCMATGAWLPLSSGQHNFAHAHLTKAFLFLNVHSAGNRKNGSMPDGESPHVHCRLSRPC